ncbi:hypothetical protein EVAR_22861_1 [Eumeta japonica]|uniref:RNA-binding protein RO60 vWA domain-containing protein n=1 Tax=Eumeta variegata TaxID=151549 RepID=A0A4C1UTY8_EUMVA|nr:hypothetical protein EVAR_22861_1 [Eumeta japonica]
MLQSQRWIDALRHDKELQNIMDREEREQQRILSILEESDSDYENSTSETEDEEDHLSVCNQESDTDQDMSGDNSDNEPLVELRRRLHSSESASELQQSFDSIDQPPNETVLDALNKLFDQTWLLTPATGMRYMITMDMRHHMFKGRHFCKSYSVKSDKKKAKTGSTTASTAGGDADNAEKKSKKRIFAECFYNNSVTPGHAAIVLALQILKREKNVTLAVFTEGGVQILNIERNFTNIEEAEYIFRNANNGRVQLDAPIQWAIKSKAKFDVFINIIDRTTRLMELDRAARWGRGPGGRYAPPPLTQGFVQDRCPVRALEKYRKECKQPNSKLIVMSLASHRIATSDGSHTGVLDTVGIDEHLPKVLDEFVKGQFY